MWQIGQKGLKRTHEEILGILWERNIERNSHS